MTIDISSMLESAALRRDIWTDCRFISVVEQLSQATGGWVQYDPGAGEDWARILWIDELLAMVCRLMPIAFINERSMTEPVAEICRLAELIVVKVDSFASTDLRVDPAVYEAAFGAPGRTPVDIECMSALDLWWSTV